MLVQDYTPSIVDMGMKSWKRMTMCTRVCCLFRLFVTSVAGFGQDAPAKVKLYGIVKDQTGAVIPFAAVLVHRDRQTRTMTDLSADIRLEVNERGQYSTLVEPGLYDVAAFASVFSPQCAKVRVTGRSGST